MNGPPVPPRWLPWSFAAVMLTGLGLFIGGPIASMLVANAQARAGLAPDERGDAQLLLGKQAEALERRREKDAWVIPVGLAMTAMGTMGLLFLFVTRPLGDDLNSDPDDGASDGAPTDGA